MGALVPFAYGDALVRVVEIDAAPWWVAGDVAKVLGFKHTPHMTRLLDEDEKGVRIMDTLGGQQEMVIVSESGLYHAILKSRRPGAQAFRKWVTSEVLPAIRKNGFYQAPRRDGDGSVHAARLQALREREPSEAEAARRDRAIAVMAFIEERMAEGLTKSRAVAEAGERFGVSPGTVYTYCNKARMVPQEDLAVSLTPTFVGGGGSADIHPDVWQDLTERMRRPGSRASAVVKQVCKIAEARGWPLPNPKTLERRLRKHLDNPGIEDRTFRDLRAVYQVDSAAAGPLHRLSKGEK